MRALLAILLLGVAARAEEAFDLVTVECPRNVDYQVFRDLTGDGISDLLLITSGEAWFWKGRTRGLPKKPDAVLKLPAGTALFDLGRTADDAHDRLVVRTHDAYWTVPLEGDAQRLAVTSGPGLPIAPANVLWRGFFRDLDLDKKPDFIDVSLDGYRIRYGAGDEQVLPPQVVETGKTLGTAVSARRVARYALAQWSDGNFNGDLRPDFAVETEEGLLVYTGDSKGRFRADRTVRIGIPEASDSDLYYLDLNRDGQTDLVAVQRKKGLAIILVASPTEGLAKARRAELKVPGEMRYPVLTDLDGDGRPDLALPYVPRPSFADAVRVLARGEFLVKAPVFLNRGGARPFPAMADTRLTLPVRVRMQADATGRIRLSGLIIVEYEGDLDGDGRKDFVVTERTDRLAVYRGSADSAFRETVWTHIPIPDCAAYDSVKSGAADLNGDERSDIILLYRGEGRRPDAVHLLLSRKD